MSLRGDIAAQAMKPGPRCGVAALLAALDDELAAELADCLGDPEIRSSDLSRVLRDRGHSISEYILQRHRRHVCGCSRAAAA